MFRVRIFLLPVRLYTGIDDGGRNDQAHSNECRGSEQSCGKRSLSCHGVKDDQKQDIKEAVHIHKGISDGNPDILIGGQGEEQHGTA